MIRSTKLNGCIRRFSAAAVAASMILSCNMSSLASDAFEQEYTLPIQEEFLYGEPAGDVAISVDSVCDLIPVPQITDMEPFEELGSASESTVIEETAVEESTGSFEVSDRNDAGEAEETADVFDAVEKKIALTTFIKKKKYRT